MEPWQGSWLSKAARVILMNSSLVSLLMYVMGFYSLHKWEELLECVALHTPSLEPASLSWRLKPSGRFSTRSLYQAIVPTLGPIELLVIWENKLPLKIRIFFWQWV